MKKRSYLGMYSLIMTVLLLIGFFPTALSAWVGPSGITWSEESDEGIAPTPATAVAYRAQYDSAGSSVTSTTYYTSLGRALQDAHSNGYKDIIYVIPSLGNGNEYSQATAEDSYKWTKTLATLDSTYATRSTYYIDSGDTLEMPYDITNGTVSTFSRTGTASGSFGDCLDYSSDVLPKTTFNKTAKPSNCKSEVVLESNLSLIINGTLNIGGVLGNNNQTNGLSGQTGGSYCLFSMKSGSLISVGTSGTLQCYGFVKEWDENSPSQGIVSYGLAEAPAVFYDFIGGTYSTMMYFGGTTFPVNIFDFPNIQVYLKIMKNSLFRLDGGLYMNDDFHDFQFDLIRTSGSSSTLNYIFEIASSAASTDYIGLDYQPAFQGDVYIRGDYDSSSSSYSWTTRRMGFACQDVLRITNNSNNTDYAHKTKFDIHCNSSIQDLTIADFINIEVGGASILSQEVSTSGKFFPFSYKFDVDIISGTISVPVDIKFMPGSSFVIGEEATVNLTGSAIAYSAEKYYDSNYSSRPGSPKYPKGFPDAYICNNGVLNVTGSFGGFLDTEGSTGKTVFSSSSSVSTTSCEWDGTNRRENDVQFAYWLGVWKLAGSQGQDAYDISMSATGEIDTVGNTTNFNARTYYASEGCWIDQLSGFSISISSGGSNATSKWTQGDWTISANLSSGGSNYNNEYKWYVTTSESSDTYSLTDNGSTANFTTFANYYPSDRAYTVYATVTNSITNQTLTSGILTFTATGSGGSFDGSLSINIDSGATNQRTDAGSSGEWTLSADLTVTGGVIGDLDYRWYVALDSDGNTLASDGSTITEQSDDSIANLYLASNPTTNTTNTYYVICEVVDTTTSNTMRTYMRFLGVGPNPVTQDVRISYTTYSYQSGYESPTFQFQGDGLDTHSSTEYSSSVSSITYDAVVAGTEITFSGLYGIVTANINGTSQTVSGNFSVTVTDVNSVYFEIELIPYTVISASASAGSATRDSVSVGVLNWDYYSYVTIEVGAASIYGPGSVSGPTLSCSESNMSYTKSGNSYSCSYKRGSSTATGTALIEFTFTCGSISIKLDYKLYTYRQYTSSGWGSYYVNGTAVSTYSNKTLVYADNL